MPRCPPPRSQANPQPLLPLSTGPLAILTTYLCPRKGLRRTDIRASTMVSCFHRCLHTPRMDVSRPSCEKAPHQQRAHSPFCYHPPTADTFQELCDVNIGKWEHQIAHLIIRRLKLLFTKKKKGINTNCQFVTPCIRTRLFPSPGR